MYVDPFWVGVLAGAVGMFCILMALAVWAKSKRDKEMF